MKNANVTLNLPSRYKKGLMSTFGVMVAPFYKCDEVAREGAPVVIDGTKADTVMVAVAGRCADGVFGLIAQNVYDPAVLGVLSGYQFHNNTAARLGEAVGVMTGAGWVTTNNYSGVVAINDKLYPGPSGYLVASQTASDKAVGVAETAGNNGDVYIRVRVNFAIA